MKSDPDQLIETWFEVVIMTSIGLFFPEYYKTFGQSRILKLFLAK